MAHQYDLRDRQLHNVYQHNKVLLNISQASKLPSTVETKNTDGLSLLHLQSVNWALEYLQKIGARICSSCHRAKTCRPIVRKR